MSYVAHPTAIVKSIDIADGTTIGPFAYISEGVKIGKKCHLGMSVYIDSDVVIEDNVEIQNFASISKGVKIEDSVLIGPHSVIEGKIIKKETKIWHFVHIRKGSTIGNKCVIGKSVYVDENVEICNEVHIQNFVSIFKGVKLEDKVFVGPSVTFTNDRYPRSKSVTPTWDSKNPDTTQVREGASIGANSTIIGGVIIGEYATVGAGSLVAKNVRQNSLVYGNPATPRGEVCFCGKKLHKEDLVSDDLDTKVYKCKNQKCLKNVIIDKN